ncbi:Fc.00g060060.m01.CDS01 [Cosmosporella sp. VM-42]
MADQDRAAYTVVREGNFFDRMYYLYHRLGIQNNLLVSARYVPTSGGGRLSRAQVTAALKQVVEAHSGLAAVAVPRPSPKKGNHRLHVALLHRIDLDACVEFLDDEEPGPEFFSRLHNQWDWVADEPEMPWWKVYVLDGQDVVFLYHHGMADGLSGMTFHKTFLRALNSLSPDGAVSTEKVLTIDPSKTALFPHTTTLSKHKASILFSVWEHIKYVIFRLWFGKTLLFNDLPPSKPYLASATEVATPGQQAVTRVSSVRVSAKKMGTILAACRKNQTTFTPLLATMFLVTFAAEVFPNAAAGISSCPYSLFPYLRMPKLAGVEKLDGVMTNGAAATFEKHYLKKYRDAMVGTGKEGKALDIDAAWRLTREYRQYMQTYMPERGMLAWIGCELLGADIEDFVNQGLSSIGNLMKMIFSVSNIGAFAMADEPPAQAAWRVDDLQFSVAASNGNHGYHGFKFAVAGVKGGDTIINCSCEEDVVTREMAEQVLALTMEKIEAMI